MKRERERERGLEVDVNKSIFNSEINEVNILNERCKSVMFADDIPNVSDRPSGRPCISSQQEKAAAAAAAAADVLHIS